jgi:hypothetical protein
MPTPVAINRSLVVVKPKEPFLEWLRSLPDPHEATAEDLLHDNTVFLVPEILDPKSEARTLKRCFKAIFEEQLNGWWTDEAVWPRRRDLRTFKEWFDVEVHTLVYDLGDGSIRDEGAF